MASHALLCLFAGLVLTCSASEDKPDQGAICEFFVIRSYDSEPKEERITDDYGQPADIVSVVIIKRLTSARCVLDDSVKVSESSVTVKKNCQAQLKICYRLFREPEPTVRPGCKLVRLLSRLNREAEEVLESRILSMTLVRQFPEGVTCVQRENFGFRGKTVFAKSGCRADFEVCLEDNRPTEDPICQLLVLRSTAKRDDQRKIVDAEGNGVTVVSVKLVKQISNVKCIEWKTFNYNERFVTAKSGCEGRFNVCYLPGGPGPEATPPTGCISVRLLSTPNKSVRKRLTDEEDSIKSIRVKRQFSEVKCIINKSFGIRDTDVYASGGCRAEFLVCLTGPLPHTESPQAICINVLLSSLSSREPDWKKVTGKGGAPVIIKSIRLLRQDSDEACIESSTYFIKGTDEVHATRRCRGKFRVCYIYASA